MNDSGSRMSVMAKVIGTGVVIIALFSVPLFASSFNTGLATRMAIFALFALSFNLVFGAGGMPSLGHAAFFGVGAYVAGIGSVRYGLGFATILVLSLVFGALLGGLMGLLTIRTQGVYLLLLTLAVGQAVWGLSFQQVRLTGGDNGISGVPREMLPFGSESVANFYWAVLVIVLLFAAILWWFQRSPVGVAIVAHRESATRLAALGYQVSYYRVAAFAVSGSVAAVAGVLFALFNRFVGPENLAWQTSAEVMLIAIVGGATYFAGPAVGAVILVGLESWAIGATERWVSILGLTYILSMLFLPRGVLGFADDLITRRRRKAPPDASAAPTPDPTDVDEKVRL